MTSPYFQFTPTQQNIVRLQRAIKNSVKILTQIENDEIFINIKNSYPSSQIPVCKRLAQMDF